MKPTYLCAALIALALSGTAWADQAAKQEAIAYVIDGDTVVMRGGEHIRLRIIDAPETFHAKCDSERAAGLAAKEYLKRFLGNQTVAVRRDGVDRFGRTLAYLAVGGKDVGAAMLKSGHARVWNPHRRIDWCAGRKAP